MATEFLCHENDTVIVEVKEAYGNNDNNGDVLFDVACMQHWE